MSGDQPRYTIHIHRSVLKELRSVGSVRVRKQLVDRISKLAADPRPVGCEMLRGYDAFRIRHGDYRIVYTIRDDILTVYVIVVGNRKNVYEKLKRR